MPELFAPRPTRHSSARRALTTLAVALSAGVACSPPPPPPLGRDAGAAAGSDPREVAFHAEPRALPDFSFDTGWQPAGQPVQFRATLAAAGGDTIDARAVLTRRGDGVTLAARVGGGRFVQDVHVQLHALLKVDVATIHFEGPVMGAPELDLRVGGTQTFDPFLLGTSAPLHTVVPRTMLATIPLMPTLGVPGDLVVAASGVVDSDLSGECAAVAPDGTSEYRARVTTRGTITLHPQVVLRLPFMEPRTFTLPDVPVDVPASSVVVTMPGRDAEGDAGAASGPPGASLAANGTCGGPDAGSADAASSSDGAVMVGSLDASALDGAALDVASTPSDARTTADALDDAGPSDSDPDAASADASAEIVCVTTADCPAGMQCLPLIQVCRAPCGASRECPAGWSCSGGYCTPSCTPYCAGRTCGDDGCGGSCGACAADQRCAPTGQCVARCESAADCGSCARNVGCGWCAGSHTCVPLAGGAPAAGSVCAGSVATVEAACTDRCFGFGTCGLCTAVPGCGWCYLGAGASSPAACLAEGPTRGTPASLQPCNSYVAGVLACRR